MTQELIRYIRTYYLGLFNEQEYKAYRHIVSLEKLEPVKEKDGILAIYKKKEWISSDPEVLRLIENGSEHFFKTTVGRILNESSDKVFINNCSNCGKLARTPKARQCRHCGNKWFDTNL